MIGWLGANQFSYWEQLENLDEIYTNICPKALQGFPGSRDNSGIKRIAENSDLPSESLFPWGSAGQESEKLSRKQLAEVWCCWGYTKLECRGHGEMGPASQLRPLKHNMRGVRANWKKKRGLTEIETFAPSSLRPDWVNGSARARDCLLEAWKKKTKPFVKRHQFFWFLCKFPIQCPDFLLGKSLGKSRR